MFKSVAFQWEKDRNNKKEFVPRPQSFNVANAYRVLHQNSGGEASVH
jgi:hypothetical protein